MILGGGRRGGGRQRECSLNSSIQVCRISVVLWLLSQDHCNFVLGVNFQSLPLLWVTAAN